MLRRLSIRKITISTLTLLVVFLICIIPSKDKVLETNKELIYIDNNVLTSNVFLLNDYNYLAQSQVVVSSDGKNIEARAKELLLYLITNSSKESKVPSGFRAILPSDTKILSVKYDEGLLKVNFSKEILDISEDMEEKMIEAIVYTLTTLTEVKNVIIYVDGDILSKLPKTGINLPSTLNRDFGINKEYDITNTANINRVTTYYISKYNDTTYYVPVTKYVNDDREKITIIIDNLSSSSYYNTNLMSYLNSNVKILAMNKTPDELSIVFNNYIFQDMEEKKILEEVIETICLSVYDNYDVNNIAFVVSDEEIYKSVSKSIEN